MPTWIVDPRSPALATSTTGAPQHNLTISFMNSLLCFLLVKSLIVFLCFVGLKFPTQRFPSFTNTFFHSQGQDWKVKDRRVGSQFSFKLRSERREGRSESKGLIRIKSGGRRTAARKGNTENRGKRLTDQLWSVWLV